MRKITFALITVVLLFTAGRAFAAAKLKIGDPAPAIKVGQWIKGPAVKKIETGKIYVIEFWATWCGPCRMSIPHLTELAKKYKGKVTFAGISIWEQVPPKEVAAFVKSMGSKMSYPVATDTSSGTMAKTWMDAAGEKGVPTAFIIGKNRKIAWIGHPMAMDGPLSKIVSGKYNAAIWAKERAAAKAEEEKSERLSTEITSLVEQGKPKEALAKLDEYVGSDPALEMEVVPTRLQLLYLADEPAGYAYIRKLAETRLKDNASALIWLAGSIIDPNNKLKSPDYDLALSLTGQVAKLKGEDDPRVLDAYSRIYESKGDTTKAIEYAEKTVKVAEADKNGGVPRDALDMLKARVETLKGKQK